MIDARQQIRTALLAVCNNVQMSKPEGDVTLPLICFAERQNTPINMCHIRLGWRVAVYANDFEALVDKVNAADEVMSGTLGYTLTAKTPDDQARIGTDLYLCRLDYSAIVDTRDNTLIKYSR